MTSFAYSSRAVIDSDFFAGNLDACEVDAKGAGANLTDRAGSRPTGVASCSRSPSRPPTSEDSHANVAEGEPGLDGKKPVRLNGSSRFALRGDVSSEVNLASSGAYETSMSVSVSPTKGVGSSSQRRRLAPARAADEDEVEASG
jgi:hypothetical protein